MLAPLCESTLDPQQIRYSPQQLSSAAKGPRHFTLLSTLLRKETDDDSSIHFQSALSANSIYKPEEPESPNVQILLAVVALSYRYTSSSTIHPAASLIGSAASAG